MSCMHWLRHERAEQKLSYHASCVPGKGNSVIISIFHAHVGIRHWNRLYGFGRDQHCQDRQTQDHQGQMTDL